MAPHDAATAPALTRAQADDLAARWAAVMRCYAPRRERTLEELVALLGELQLLDDVVDLGGGVGAVAGRVAAVSPAARVRLVDDDPVMLAVARARHGHLLDVVDHDLTDGGWVERVGPGRVGAVVAAFVLHMVPSGGYRSAAGHVARALRPGGLLLDWDEMPLPGAVGAACARRRAAVAQVALSRLGEDVRDWYASIEQLPAGRALLAERHARYAGRRDEPPLRAAERTQLLRAAGFREVAEVARQGDVAVLAAVR